MKSEAPEKIWVHELSARELNVPLKEYHIEYIRADAFIEKAIKYIANHFLAPGMDNEIKDFINYMEEE